MKTKKVKTLSRRQVLKNLAVLPLLGVAGKDILPGHMGNDLKAQSETLQDLKGILPKGKLGSMR